MNTSSELDWAVKSIFIRSLWKPITSSTTLVAAEERMTLNASSTSMKGIKWSHSEEWRRFCSMSAGYLIYWLPLKRSRATAIWQRILFLSERWQTASTWPSMWWRLTSGIKLRGSNKLSSSLEGLSAEKGILRLMSLVEYQSSMNLRTEMSTRMVSLTSNVQTMIWSNSPLCLTWRIMNTSQQSTEQELNSLRLLTLRQTSTGRSNREQS